MRSWLFTVHGSIQFTIIHGLFSSQKCQTVVHGSIYGLALNRTEPNRDHPISTCLPIGIVKKNIYQQGQMQDFIVKEANIRTKHKTYNSCIKNNISFQL